jgi:Zn-dependent metalloprotease
MSKALNHLVRPALFAVLVSSACSVMAAGRVDLETITPTPSLGAQSIHSLTGLSTNDLKHLRTRTINGNSITRYQQYHLGVPVWGEAIVAKAPTNALTTSTPALTGGMLRNLAQDLPSAKTTVSQAAALQKAKSLAGAQVTSNEQAQLYIRQGANGAAHLFYLISFINDSAKAPSRPFYMIDATSGAVLEKWEGLNHVDGTGPGGNGKTGLYEYQVGGKYGPLNVSQSGSTCSLDSPNVYTVNMNGGTANLSTAHTFTCPRNAVKAINGAYGPMNDAHFAGNVVFNMYQSYLGIRPISQKLKMRVHYGTSYENAFWDGTQMTFGDGGGTFYPLVSLDVAAHEVSHGFTEQHSRLTFSGQAAGISESFSDMAGEAAEFFARGSNDWMVGAEVFKTTGALRYLANPGLDGKSIDHASKYTSTMDPHYSSGVYNKAFYTLAKTTGWDVKKAFQVMAHANDLYWTSTSTFNAGACGVEKAATDYGYSKADVTAAFAVVGVSCLAPPATTVLTSGVTVGSISLASGTGRMFSIVVPAGKASLTFKLSGGTGNGNIYARISTPPTTTSYTKRSVGTTNTETITWTSPGAGTYYLLVHAASTVTSTSLLATLK